MTRSYTLQNVGGAAALLATTLLPAAGQAQGTGEWDFFGQLSFGAMSIDNGGGRETFFAENGHSGNRVGLTYAAALTSGTKVTFKFETGFGFSDLSDASPGNSNMQMDFDETDMRKLEVIVETPRAGTFYIGQGSMASDGGAGVDLSGTALAHGPAIGDLGGSVAFLDPTGADSGVAIGDVFDDLDGPRRLRLRYDTPEWNGLFLAVAAGREVLRDGDDRDYRDISVNYARETGDFEAEAIVSYEWKGSDEEIALASAGILHTPTGLNVSIATGANQIGDGSYVYLKLGVKRDFFDFGQTAMALEYYDGSDFDVIGSSSKAIGLGIVQTVDAANLEIVGTLRRYELSAPAAEFQDVDVAMIGARWKF